jgi:hypothetical protein
MAPFINLRERCGILLILFLTTVVNSDADPMFQTGGATVSTPVSGNQPDLKKFSQFKSPEPRAGLTSAGANLLAGDSAKDIFKTAGKTGSSFYKRKDEAQKQAAEAIEETLSHMSSVSQKGAVDYLAKNKLINRAKSNQLSQMKVYNPVGFSTKKMYVSKDAPAQHQ